MADVIKELEVTIRPRMIVDEDTAKVCLKLVEMFLNSNREYHFINRRTVEGEYVMEVKKQGNE